MVSAAGNGPVRALGAWGFEGERFPPSLQLLTLLESRLGRAVPFPQLDPARLRPPAPRRLPDLGAPASAEAADRVAHARGQGITDLIPLRSGTCPAYPDAVARPASDDEVESVLRACARAGARVIPRGGGTSVTGGVNVIAGDVPVVSLDLARFSGLERIDSVSGLATIGAGTLGPAVEQAPSRPTGSRSVTSPSPGSCRASAAGS
jgi:alkyldihydroxyacetonephosphate synthase